MNDMMEFLTDYLDDPIGDAMEEFEFDTELEFDLAIEGASDKVTGDAEEYSKNIMATESIDEDEDEDDELGSFDFDSIAEESFANIASMFTGAVSNTTSTDSFSSACENFGNFEPKQSVVSAEEASSDMESLLRNFC